MGNFRSHFYGGLFLGIYGLWLSFLCASRFVIILSCKKNKSIEKQLPKRYKLYLGESFMKLGFYLIMVALERPPLKFWNSETETIVHVTSLAGFGLASFVEILVLFGHELPKKLDMFLMNCLSFGILAFMLVSHANLNGMLETFLHNLFVYALLACIFFSFLEIFNPEEILFTYGKVAAILLQGLSFNKIAYVIYGENRDEWDPKNHETMMRLTANFCWHIFGIIIFLIVQLACIKKLYHSFSLVERFINWLMVDHESKSGLEFQMFTDYFLFIIIKKQILNYEV